jgi:hypothetical protein
MQNIGPIRAIAAGEEGRKEKKKKRSLMVCLFCLGRLFAVPQCSQRREEETSLLHYRTTTSLRYCATRQPASQEGRVLRQLSCRPARLWRLRCSCAYLTEYRVPNCCWGLPKLFRPPPQKAKIVWLLTDKAARNTL